MFIFTSSPSFLIFFISFFLLYYTSGISIHVHSSHLPDGVKIIGDKHIDEKLSWMAWKSVAVEGGQANTTLVLARERTRRIDIFNHFECYNGGWNISNPDYILSVVSTSIPFLVVAATWFVIFGIILHISCVCYGCCSGDPYGHSQLAYYASLIFLILCTIVTIGGCVVLHYSEQQFHGTTSNTMKYVVNQVEFTEENLKNVSNYLDSAKKIAIELGLPPNVEKSIDSVKNKIMVTANDLSKKTSNNSKMLHNGFDGMRLALIIVAISILIVSILGFLTSILGLKCILYSLAVAGWILVAGTFIFCGAFVFLHK
ncbi:envelope glycoprotein B [Trifolium repens]|nr:envelope glycoprotein B [Trifolium repens]